MIGWLDAQAGASGDMLLGALVDAGVPLRVLQGAVDQLGLPVRLAQRPVTRAGLGATKVDVLADDEPVRAGHGSPGLSNRTWADVRRLLDQLDEPVRTTAHEAFRRLAEAEARVHRVPVDEVHFHEVGALDALADVVGTVAGFHHLGLTALHCSAVSLGSGTTRGAHGPLPVPAPAVLALLAGVPVVAGPAPQESTTPTGAALLATLVTHWGALPPMAVDRVGHGAGSRDPAEVANLLRLVLGEQEGPASTALLLEANIDDLDPRLWPHAIAQLLAAGASDAWLTAITMKKGRPAHTLSVLCSEEVAAAVRTVVFRETSTIGLRESRVGKRALDRTETTVHVGGQSIRVKTAWLDGVAVNANPEWSDIVAAAVVLDRPAKQVLAEAIGQVHRT